MCRLFNTRWHVILLTRVCCVNLRVDFFGLCVILRRMPSITSSVRTAGALCFRALCTDPVVRFLTNVFMALFAGMPLHGNLSSKIPRVSLIESVLTYASTIATLSSIEYILHNAGYRCSLNATLDSTVAVKGEKCWQLTAVHYSKRFTGARDSNGIPSGQNITMTRAKGRRATFSCATLCIYQGCGVGVCKHVPTPT
jgi:hypothetical protein